MVAKAKVESLEEHEEYIQAAIQRLKDAVATNHAENNVRPTNPHCKESSDELDMKEVKLVAK
jgi:hypothetical protein